MVSLGYVFMVLAFFCALAISYALWRSVMSIIAPSALLTQTQTAEREELLQKKHMLLLQLKDLELEKALDKMSDEDYQHFQAKFREQAKETMLALDNEIAPFRDEALALVERARKKAGA